MIKPQRLAEVAAMLPLLHVRAGPTVVGVLGPLSPVMATEALRWRDTTTVLSLAPLAITDRRVRQIDTLEPASCDVLLMSPDHLPVAALITALKPSGVIQVITLDIDKIALQNTTLKRLVGNCTPWRDHLPQTIWGAMACVGGSCSRIRQPPGGARHLSTQFLPCLFTFAKDELPLVFPQNNGTLSPTPTR